VCVCVRVLPSENLLSSVRRCVHVVDTVMGDHSATVLMFPRVYIFVVCRVFDYCFCVFLRFFFLL